MFSITHVKFFKVLEWIVFIVLLFVSFFLSRVVVHQFISERTTLSYREEPIKELPTIVFCFSMSDSSKTSYEYGLDFQIEYLLIAGDNATSKFLVEGNNTLLEEIVRLDKIIAYFMGICYKVSYFFKNPYNHQFSLFSFHFNQSFPWRDTPTLNAYFTSEINAYGIAFNEWKNGRVAKIEVDKGLEKTVDVRTEMIFYLKGVSKCSHESFYECFSRLVRNESSNACFPGSLPFLPICNVTSLKAFWSFWNKISKNGQCPKLCHTMEYSLQTSRTIKESKNSTMGLSYVFDSSNSNMLVYEEYWVYDMTSMIGSVGGTLGMCIGFSFTGVLSSFFRILQQGIMAFKGKMETHKTSSKLGLEQFERQTKQNQLDGDRFIKIRSFLSYQIEKK